MKIKFNTLFALLLLMLAFTNKSNAQWLENGPNGPPIYYIFDADSLRGFDEEAARKSAIAEHFLGAEFKVRMYQLKRGYIDSKFNLRAKSSKSQNDGYFQYEPKPTVVPGCVNEDFEASTAAQITTSTQIAGWTINSGYNGSISSGTMLPYYPGGLSGANSCNQLGCCPLPPTECELISAPSGLVDPVIGSIYPIFSVFGTTTGNANGPANNPQISGGMFGDNFVRINSSLNNYSMARLSKTFAVTSANALFQFAFISVFNTGHGCCDAGAFKISLAHYPNGPSNPPTPILCPTFTASALSSACTNTTGNITYLNAVTGTTANTSSSVIFNKWQLSSIDLTQYIGSNVRIDIVTSDCTAGGHYGYVYFDAQCGPMTVYGNNNPYAAGTGTVVVPTCGAAGATICAAAGLGPYSWAGPNIPLNLSTPNYTNSCFVTSVSATYTLTMLAGSQCNISRVVASTITPAPTLISTVLQATCGNTLAVVSITPGGSASNPANVVWSPIPLANTPTTQGQYVIPGGTAPMVVTVTATDPVGCLVTTTANVFPAAPFPTFAIVNLGTNQNITCANPVVNLNAVSNYSYNGNSLNYSWVGSNATFSTNTAGIILPGTFTVTATDPITNCSATKTIAVTSNTVKPVSTVTQTFQNITCGVAPQNVTITATSPTVNVSHLILSPLGGSLLTTGFTTLYPPGVPGPYTVITINDANGCTTVRNFSVFSNTGYPTFSITSTPLNYTLGCSTKSMITINVLGATTTSVDPTTSLQVNTGGACSYTIIGPPTSTVVPSGTLSSTSIYSVTMPGTWTVITKDNVSLCEARIPVSVISNTAGPNIDTLLIPRDILDCSTPTVTLRAVSIPTNVSYIWSYDGAVGNLAANTITIAANFTAAATNTVVDQYTLTLKDENNLCKTTTVVPIYQNLFAPKALITNGGISAITCKTQTIMLNNSSTSNIPLNGPKFPTGAPVVGFLWKGPSPQLDQSNVSTYVAAIAGAYTMTAKDLGNGCTTTTVLSITDARDYPFVIIDTTKKTVLDCGKGGVIKPNWGTVRTGWTYSWTAPGEFPTSPKTRDTLYTENPGEYKILVTNTISGCESTFDFNVVSQNSISSSFIPDQITGYVPLTVSFSNTSKTSTGSGSITSVWNFGNSTSATFSSVATATTVFRQPGTYTVTLFTAKGNCLGSTYKVINVESPSSLSIPNVFTPNGDGVNDFFFLKTTGLAEITAVIFDRWGHKVYELSTTKGNISWDGKNQFNKDCPEGAYFFVIKAKGKDDKDFEQKGTITLFR